MSEGYGRVYNFGYDKFQVDPRPRMLILGKWRHPTTRNILLAGINLNYLSDDQVIRLREALPKILAPKNLKSRYWRGRGLVPDVFETSYRTYDQDWVGNVTRDTLKFYPSPADLERQEAETAADTELQAKGFKTPKRKPVAEPEIKPTPEMEPEAEPGLEAEPVTQEPEPEIGKAEIPEEEPTTEKPESPEGMEQEFSPETTETGETPATKIEPEVEETPVKQPGGKLKKTGKKLTSVQRRKLKAKQIKKAVEQQKLTQPPPKPEPPDEIKGALGMFKKKPK